jgi:septal ring factor EnvC (AmiA/AmiB activator)
LVADAANSTSNQSTNISSDIPWSAIGTITAALLAAGVGIYTVNSKKRQDDKLQESNNNQDEKNRKFEERMGDIDRGFQKQMKQMEQDFQERMKKIDARLATQKSEKDALREYRFDARKHLYNEFEPLLF